MDLVENLDCLTYKVAHYVDAAEDIPGIVQCVPLSLEFPAHWQLESELDPEVAGFSLIPLESLGMELYLFIKEVHNAWLFLCNVNSS